MELTGRQLQVTSSNAYSGTDSITFTIDSTPPTAILTDTDAETILYLLLYHLLIL